MNIKLSKQDDGNYEVSYEGQVVGRVMQAVDSNGREMWTYTGNQYGRALFFRPYDAARKLVDKLTRPNSLEMLNGRPLQI